MLFRSVNVFELYLNIPKLPIVNHEIKYESDTTYLKINYFTAIASTNAGLGDKAIQHYSELKDKNIKESLSVYQLLYEEYVKKKDTVNFVKIAKEGCQKFPKEGWFIENLINYYVFSGKSSDALIYVNSAIEREPNKAQYRFIKGNLDESLGKVDDALLSFDKAVELDPTIADAYAGKGRLYFNIAVKMSDKAQEIKDVKQYNVEMKKVDDAFKKSIPYFQKATELKPAEREYKTTLKTLYYRLKKDPIYEAKYDAITKEIEAMKK